MSSCHLYGQYPKTTHSHTGLDNLPAGLLKDSTDDIVKQLTHIINLCLNTATFPSAWKSAKVIPVYR